MIVLIPDHCLSVYFTNMSEFPLQNDQNKCLSVLKQNNNGHKSATMNLLNTNSAFCDT